MNLDELRERLSEDCARRDLGPAARIELERLLREGTADELRNVVEHLRACPVVRADELHPDPATTAAFVSAWAESERRADAHRRRVVAVARKLGADVGTGRTTAADARARLNNLAHALDESAPIPLEILPWRVADELAREAFAEGVQSIRKVT